MKLTEEEKAAITLQLRISKLINGLLSNKPAWGNAIDINKKLARGSVINFEIRDGHDICQDCLSICHITVLSVIDNSKEVRDLVKAVADRWGVDITLEGID